MKTSDLPQIGLATAPAGITQLLLKWNNGDSSAREELIPLVYDELRRLAVRHMRRERANHTLEPTALVNEAYLRLIGQNNVEWQNRAQFFGLAAKLMRNILVDHARTQRAAKRGGEHYNVSLNEADRVSSESSIDLVALNETLERLTTHDSQKSHIVELRFFGGLTIEETAEVLEISPATVERDWRMARAWLRRELS